jgi:hypothetical protein
MNRAFRIEPRAFFSLARSSILLALASGLAMGCESDDTRLVPQDPPPTGGDPSGMNPETPGGTLYALAVSVYNPDASQTYLLTSSDLVPGELDVRGRGIELPGFLFPFSNGKSIFVPHEDAPSLTRYELDESDALQEGPTVSFAGVGYAAAMDSFNLPFVSESKAYAFDAPNSLAHLWNPSTMTLLDGQIDISTIQRDGFVARIAADADAARRQGDLLFVPVGWEDAVTEDTRPASGMLVIDTRTDTLVKFLEDERCTEFQSSIQTPNGDIYFFPSEHGIVTLSGANPEYPSCVLRIRAGESDFDPDFLLNLATITGRPIACCGAWAGGSDVLVPVLYEERIMISDRRELWSESNNDYRYWRINLDTRASREITSLPFFNSGGPNVYELADGRVFRALTLRPEDGPDESTLLELTAGEEPAMGASFQGSLTLMTQLR